MIQSLVKRATPTNLVTIMYDCRWLLYQLQNFNFSHVLREANSVVDLLAEYWNEHSKKLLLYNSPPSYVLSPFNNNVIGSVCQRITDYFAPL